MTDNFVSFGHGFVMSKLKHKPSYFEFSIHNDSPGNPIVAQYIGICHVNNNDMKEFIIKKISAHKTDIKFYNFTVTSKTGFQFNSVDEFDETMGESTFYANLISKNEEPPTNIFDMSKELVKIAVDVIRRVWYKNNKITTINDMFDAIKDTPNIPASSLCKDIVIK